MTIYSFASPLAQSFQQLNFNIYSQLPAAEGNSMASLLCMNWTVSSRKRSIVGGRLGPSGSSAVWAGSAAAEVSGGKRASALTWGSSGSSVNPNRIAIFAFWGTQNSFELLLDSGITGISLNPGSRMYSFRGSSFGSQRGLSEPIFHLAAGVSTVKKQGSGRLHDA